MPLIKSHMLSPHLLTALKYEIPDSKKLITKLPSFPIKPEIEMATYEALEEYSSRNPMNSKEAETEKKRRQLCKKG